MMNDKVIQELICIVQSVELSKRRWKNYEFTPNVITRCKDFCTEYDINITHGSAYRELKHKSYYYKDKYIANLLNNKTDLYGLRKANVISDKEIVDRILKKGN